MNISSMFATGSRILNGDSVGRTRSDLVQQLIPVGRRGYLALDLVGVAGEKRDHDARRGVEPALPDYQMRREVTGGPALAERRRVGSDGAHGLDE
jgi:hypothetical protein